jgi:serine/threonine-protein kinase
LHQPKRLALLTYLAVARPYGFQRKERILLLFWPDSDEERARAALRKSAYALRQALGSEAIQSRGDDDMAVDPRLFRCDVREFAAAIADGRPADALDLYHGDLLDGFHLDGASPEFEQWLESERARLRKDVAQAAWDVAEAQESAGDMRAAARTARRAFELLPPDGERFRHLLEILDKAGDRAGVLQEYEKFSGWLADEYGAEPPPETVQLVERIRSRSEATATTAPAPPRSAEVEPQDLQPEPSLATTPRPGTAWRRAGILVAFLAAIALVPAILALRGNAPPDLDPNLVAVAPFSVFNPEHEVWGEGIVDYLSRSLDHAGQLRTLPPTAAVRAWPGRADVESAEVAGRRTGAGIVVFGSLMGIGDDSVRVSATLVDIAGPTVLGDVEIRGTPERMDQLVDSLTMEVLRDLSDTRQIGAMRHTSIGSRSMPALKAFLAGEQAFRRTAWDSARAHYGRAIELDSTFAMGHMRLGSTILFIELGVGEEGWEHIVRAGEMNHGLSHHDSLLVAVSADVAAGKLGRLPEGGYEELALSAYRGALQAIKEYPDDAESWYSVGVVRDLFYDDLHNVTVAQIADAFDQAIELDSAFAPAYRLAFRYAMDEGRVEKAREYTRKYLSLNPPEKAGELALLLNRLLDPQAPATQIDSLLASVHPETLFLTWIRLWLLTDPAELAIRVARESEQREHDPRYWFTADFVEQRNLAAVLAYRGHIKESAEVAGTYWSGWFQAIVPEGAMLGTVSAEVADSVFADWLEYEKLDPDVITHALWWWASRSDTSAVLRYLERGGDEPIGRTALALARGDTAQAILLFEKVRTSWVHTNLTVLTRAKLLESQGRDAEALEVLRQRFLNDWPFASRVLWIMERARLADRLGQPESALRDYRFVTRVWANADPELQPVVQEAEDAVSRLGG